MSIKELQNIISSKFTQQVVLDIVAKKSGLNDIQIDNIEILTDSNNKGDSYLSNVCRFIIQATGSNSRGTKEKLSLPVIVKYLPKNLARRKTFRSVDFFENEVIFYKKVWVAFEEFQSDKNISPAFNNIPLLLASCIDGCNDFVAMLDLSHEGYVSADRGTGLNYEHTSAILKVLANFHGLSLAFKEQQPERFEAVACSLKETYFAENFRSWYGKFQEKLFIIAKDAVEQELPAIYLKKLNKLFENDFFGQLCKMCEIRGPLSVVTHGDVWVPNFLIKYDPQDHTKLGRIVMIDFQLTRYTTLANDLTFFFYTCVDFNLLEKHWGDLVNEYHKALLEALQKYGSSKDLVTLENLQKEIKDNILFGLGMSLEALVMCLLEESEVSDLDAIQGDEAVPLESIWIVHPLKTKDKRCRIANMLKHVFDNFLD